MTMVNPGETTAAPQVMPDLKASIGAYLGTTVLEWEAQNVQVFAGPVYEAGGVWHGKKVGGFLRVRSKVFDGHEIRERDIEIDDNRRPFSEDVITELGERALERPTILSQISV